MYKTFTKLSALTLLFIAFFLYTHQTHAAIKELTGYAWSDGIGWISFNCKNHEPPNDAIGGPPCVIPYAVTYDDTTPVIAPGGNLHGYAWSDSVGWINFDTVGPFTGVLGAWVNNPASAAKIVTNQTKGWARFCTPLGYDAAGNFNNDVCTGNPAASIINGLRLGGWDGWVSLTGNSYSGPTNTPNGTYGATVDPITGQFSGWWWGGNESVGWIDVSGVKIPGTAPELKLRLINEVKNGTTLISSQVSPWVTSIDPTPTVGIVGTDVFPPPGPPTPVDPAPDLVIPATTAVTGGTGWATSWLKAEWDTTGLTNCTATSFGGNGLTNPNGTFANTDGSHLSSPATNELNNGTNKVRRAFSMHCTGPGGADITKTAIVDVIPNGASVTLDADPYSFGLQTGQTTALKWWTANVVPGSCQASVVPNTVPATIPATPPLTNGGISGWDNTTNPLDGGTALSPQTANVGVSFTAVNAITFNIDCVSAANAAVHVSDTAKVGYFPNSLTLTAPATSCPGSPITLNWSVGLETQYHACTASTVPAGKWNGVPNWNSNTPSNAVHGFHTSTYNLTENGGATSQTGVPIGAPGTTTTYNLTCTDTQGNIAMANAGGTPASTTTLLATDPACSSPEIGLAVTETMPTGTLIPPSVYGTTTTPPTIDVDVGHYVQLDWYDPTFAHDWKNCTASGGSPNGGATVPYKWGTIPVSVLNTANGHYLAKAKVTIPDPGDTLPYTMTCELDNGSGMTSSKTMNVHTNPAPEAMIGISATKLDPSGNPIGASTVYGPATLNVDSTEHVQLDWFNASANPTHVWTSCTASGGVPLTGYPTGFPTAHAWTNPTAKTGLNASNSYDKAETQVAIALPGQDAQYAINCTDATGFTSADRVVTIHTNDLPATALVLSFLDTGVTPTFNSPLSSIVRTPTNAMANLEWQVSPGVNIVPGSCVGIDGDIVVTNDWDGAILQNPVVGSWSTPVTKNVIHNVSQPTTFKMQCNEVGKLAPLISNTIIATWLEVEVLPGIDYLRCTDTSNMDVSGSGSVDLEWQGSNASQCYLYDNATPNPNQVGQGYPNGSATVTTDANPDKFNLTCVGIPPSTKTITQQVTVTPTGCAAGPKGVKKPKWIQF